MFCHRASLSIACVVSLLFFGSALFHEMAHSLIAIRSGKLVSSITLFIFGDVSEIRKEADRPGEEIRIALPPDGAARIISVAETLPPEVLVLPPPSSFS